MKTRPLPIALAALAALVALSALAGLAVAGRSSTTDARASARMPSVQTGPASALTSHSATINGTVKPRRSATTAYFEWGKSAAYGSSTPAQPVGSGRSTAAVAATLTGLTANTTYHYRLVARNAKGTSYGADRGFTTSSEATPTPTPTSSSPSPSPTPTPTSPSPSLSPTPAPTSSSPSPSPPPPPPPGGCTDGVTVTEGDGRSFFEPDGSEYYVHNNNWNDTAGGNSVITACDYNNWYLVSDTPDHSDLSVQTYPNVHRDYNDIPLSQIQSARFAATGPHCAGCIWNIAFDIWIGDGFSHELMIWTENWGQRPAGNQVGTTTIGGQQYQVWRSGSGDDGIITYVSITPQLSGTMPLAAFFADVRARGWTPTTTWQVDYGVEIVDTNGKPERFDFTDFFIND